MHVPLAQVNLASQSVSLLHDVAQVVPAHA
jgi:hypothetical protein